MWWMWISVHVCVCVCVCVCQQYCMQCGGVADRGVCPAIGIVDNWPLVQSVCFQLHTEKRHDSTLSLLRMPKPLWAWVNVCVCVCVCGHVYVVYEDTNLYNDMGMTEVLQGEGDLWGHFQCPHNLKTLIDHTEWVFWGENRNAPSPVRAKFRCRVGVGQ